MIIIFIDKISKVGYKTHPKWVTKPTLTYVHSRVGSIERSMLALSVALAPLNWTYHATFNFDERKRSRTATAPEECVNFYSHNIIVAESFDATDGTERYIEGQ